MNLSRTPSPRLISRCTPARLALLAILSVALLLAGPAPGALAAGEGGEHPPPPLTVTVTKSGEPRYGEDLVLQISSDGVDGGGVASILHNGTEVTAGVLQGKTTFRVPTLNRFKAGTTYTLRVSVVAEDSSGESTIRFTPAKIVPRLDLKTPQISYGAQLRFFMTHDGPAGLSPSGTVVIDVDGGRYSFPVNAGNILARHVYLETSLGVRSFTVEYSGDENFAPVEWGRQVTVKKLPTVTPASLTATAVEAGDELYVKATPVSGDGASAYQPHGEVQAYVAPAGTAAWETTGSPVSFGIGGTPQVNLTDTFVDRAPGKWEVRIRYLGTEFYEPSEAILPLTVIADPPVKVATQTTVAVDRSPVVAGTGPVTVTATVTATDHSVATGDVTFTIGGTTVEASLDAAGRAQVTRSLPVGPVTVGASYGGSATKLGSSDSLGFDVVKARTSIAVTSPSGAVAAGTAVPVQISATDSPVAPTGTFDVLEGGRRIGGGSVADGRFLLPALAPGRHALTVTYPGDELTDESRGDLVVELSGTAGPGPGTDPGTRPGDDPGTGPTGPGGPGGPADPVSTKARSRTVAKLVKVRKHRVILRVTVASNRAVTGAVQVLERGKVVGRARLKAGSKGRATVRVSSLRPGKHRLQVRYAGSASVTASTSKRLAVRIR